MRYWIAIGIILVMLGFQSCKETDDLPPILTLIGDTLIIHPLNTVYIDPGATATDETDGNLTDNIYVENTVNENLVGNYTITYKVVDEAGNEAAPISRTVSVINQGWIYMGTYNLNESQNYPGQETCNYDVVVDADSTINYRILFTDFACQIGQNIFADVTDTAVVIPYQITGDTIQTFSIQGSGFINDSIISVGYTRIVGGETSLWNAEFKRL
jgi:hypothetical protein